MKAFLTAVLVASGLVLAAGAASADDTSPNLRLMAFGSEARHWALQPEISECESRGRYRPNQQRLGRLRHARPVAVQRRQRLRRLRHGDRDIPHLRGAWDVRAP